MLKELRIKNFAIIDELHVHFGRGLHVFTGETGAGKSIIIEALSLALGGRASAEMIRSGEEMASIEAAFDLTDFSESAAVDDGLDLAVRNVNGILLDLDRHYGIYLHFGESIGFLRWLRFEMDAGLGVQVRLP